MSRAAAVADEPTPEPSSTVAPSVAGHGVAPAYFSEPTPGMLALEAAIAAAYEEARVRYGDEDGDAWLAALEDGTHPLCRIKTAVSPSA